MGDGAMGEGCIAQASKAAFSSVDLCVYYTEVARMLSAQRQRPAPTLLTATVPRRAGPKDTVRECRGCYLTG